MTYYDTCYKFNYNNNAWESAGSMSSSLSHAGEFEAFRIQRNSYLYSSISITIKGHSYHEGLGLFQTGGQNGVVDLDTVDFSSDGETWELLPTKIPDGLNKQNS